MKSINELHPEFAKEIESLTKDQLKERVYQLQKGLEESEAHKEANDELKAARANVSELNAPYRDVKTAVKLKTKYILELLDKKP